ncbi:MAG: hypothetical protein GY839_08175 [candidate division Zixibacteria bacterium]|nr:hypothetical protein [candidate division Zixibacteria bacterium]
MPYEVTVDEVNEIILVRVWDFATHNDHLNARSAAAKMCDKRQFKNLLIDLKDLKTGKGVTMMSSFRFGETLTKEVLPVDTRIAHVMPSDSDAHRAVLYATNAAKKQGGAVKDFDTLEEACQWLLSEPG